MRSAEAKEASARRADINVVKANRMMCEADSSAAVTMLWKRKRRSRQAVHALSVVDGGVGAARASGGRDQAMQPRVRQSASEEVGWRGAALRGSIYVCSVGGGRGIEAI